MKQQNLQDVLNQVMGFVNANPTLHSIVSQAPGALAGSSIGSLLSGLGVHHWHRRRNRRYRRY